MVIYVAQEAPAQVSRMVLRHLHKPRKQNIVAGNAVLRSAEGSPVHVCYLSHQYDCELLVSACAGRGVCLAHGIGGPPLSLCGEAGPGASHPQEVRPYVHLQAGLTYLCLSWSWIEWPCAHTGKEGCSVMRCLCQCWGPHSILSTHAGHMLTQASEAFARSLVHWQHDWGWQTDKMCPASC
jgi:hypothetical protein